MKQNQKGGVLMLKNTETKDSIFNNIQKLFPFGSKSVGGYLFKGELVTPYVSLYGGAPDIILPTKDVLIKLVQIQNTNENITHINDKEVIPAEKFNEEVMIQNDVFTKSFDSFLEPICPNIIYSDIITSVSFPNCSNSNLITDIMVSPRNYGIIIMEIIQDATTVHSLFPSCNSDNPDLNQNSISTNQILALKNYLYQLLRLKKIGYTHNDAHLDNGLYIVNYDYIGNMRVFLIDFGRTFVNDKYHLDDVVPSYGDWWSYKILRQFTQILSTELNITKFDDLYNHFDEEIKKSRDAYFVKLYDSNIITSLRNYTGYLVSVNEQLKMKSQFNNSYIFVKQNALLMDVSNVYQTPFERLNINFANHGYCPSKKYRFKTDSYRVEQPLQLIKPGINTYVGQTLSHIDRDARQIYLWVIGFTTLTGDIPQLFIIKSESCYEVGTKHFYIVKGYEITKYYAAGEMLVDKTKVFINFESGTYMAPLIKEWEKLQPTAKIKQIVENTVPLFILYTLNNNITETFAFDSVTIKNGTFFNPEYCCESTTLTATDEFLESVHQIMPDVVEKIPNVGDVLYNGGKHTNQNTTDLVMTYHHNHHKLDNKIQHNSPDKSILKEDKKIRNRWEKYIKTQKQQDYEMFEKMYPSYSVHYAQDVYPNIEILVNKMNHNNKNFMEGLCIINKYVDALKKREFGINHINKENQLGGFKQNKRRKPTRTRKRKSRSTSTKRKKYHK
jgi:hypothetical protein